MGSSEIIRNNDGSIYHLNLLPEEVASSIILVGDPQRVGLISKHFDKMEVKKQHREFHTHTGRFQDRRISVISTGIGTDNIDIVLNELYALVHLDWSSLEVKKEMKAIKILRLGTCGALQADLPVGRHIATRFAVGIGGLMHYYLRPSNPLLETFEAELERYVNKVKGIPTRPYGAISSSSFFQTIQTHHSHLKWGITLTSSGFYGPQGRQIGYVRSTIPDLVEKVATFSFRDFRLLNMEMETAGIYGLSEIMGFEAGSISAVLANRKTNVFASNPQKIVEDLIITGLQVMASWK